MMWTPESWYRDARKIAEGKAKHLRDHAQMVITNMLRLVPQVPRAEVLEKLKQFNRQRLEALPDLARYPELRGMRDLVDAAWRGTRDGAEMDEDTWAASCSGIEFHQRFIVGGRLTPQRAHCSYIYFPTSEVGPILANNLDSCPEEPFMQPLWPAISEHLILGAVSSGVFLDEESPEIFPAPVYQLVARYCRTTEEAVEMFTRYNHFWGPCNLLLVDRNHKVAMIEKSSCRIGVRYSPDGFGFITAMTQEHPEIRRYVDTKKKQSLEARNLPTPCADTVYWNLQDQRLVLMNELLNEARKNPSIETLRRMIQFRDPKRGNVCGNGEVPFPEGPPLEHTLRTSIWRLRHGTALWWARDSKTGKPSFENPMPDVNYSNVWKWD